ncbi:MAG: hypothetical protein ISP33_05120 [Ilumatobacteraceae bacterium]|nr:hypothetical protein [Ilumatobacteraceae bacterium]MDA2958982.1 hypothetical protein [Actinomycetota bacterium]
MLARAAGAATTEVAKRRCTDAARTDALTVRRGANPPVTADAIGDNCDIDRVTERPTVADPLAADARVVLWPRRWATCRAKEVTGDGLVAGDGDDALLTTA